MNKFPHAAEILNVYKDQAEALVNLHFARKSLGTDKKSRFYGLSIDAIEDRLEGNRNELDLWAVMMMAASFEATIRKDAENRISTRTRDVFRKPLRNLFETFPDRVRLIDILCVWESRMGMAAALKTEIRRLLKHRHWLAHGRHWCNKHGLLPGPEDAWGSFDDYIQALQVIAPDFPRL